MGLRNSKVVQSPGEARYIEEDAKTYLGERFTKVKVGLVFIYGYRRITSFPYFY